MLANIDLKEARLKKFSAFNRADKILGVVLCLFFAVLFLKFIYPEMLLLDFLLFTIEASLVGGIADWFAVTALFKKPCGFPYHTALLPKNRAKFSKSLLDMIEREFFSREDVEKMFLLLSQEDVQKELFSHLVKNEQFEAYFLDFMRDIFQNIDREHLKSGASLAVKKELQKIPPQYFSRKLEQYLQKERRLEIILAVVAEKLQEELASDKIDSHIQKLLENLVGNKSEATSGFGGFLQGFLSLTNVVNYEEAATLFKEKIALFLDELASEGSAKQKLLLGEFYGILTRFMQNEENANKMRAYYLYFVECLPLEKAFLPLCEEIMTLAKEDYKIFLTSEHGIEFRQIVQNIFNDLKSDEALQNEASLLLKELSLPFAEKIKNILLLTTKDALKNLTDDELNSIIYEKTETDLIWIRLNGTILGAMLGAIIFLLLEFLKYI